MMKLLGWFRRKKKEKKAKIEEIKLEDTKELLEEWRKTVEAIQEHPLSQAGIINTKLLELLTNLLGSVDKKLEKLDLLDEIARLLRESSEEKEAEAEEIEEDIIRKFGATVKDRDAYNILLKKGPMSAEQLALEMKVSRSTASARLNRLFNLGLVDKEARGKEIFYRAKKRVEK